MIIHQVISSALSVISITLKYFLPISQPPALEQYKVSIRIDYCIADFDFSLCHVAPALRKR